MSQLPKGLKSTSRTMQPQEIPDHAPDDVLAIWLSRRFLAVLYRDRESGARRLSVNRVDVDRRFDMWRDGITWDELQRIKTECLGGAWCVEIYPPAAHVINVANIRHLWVLETEPAYGWRAE